MTLGLVVAALIGSAVGARLFAATVRRRSRTWSASSGTSRSARPNRRRCRAGAPRRSWRCTRDVNGMQHRLRESYTARAGAGRRRGSQPQSRVSDRDARGESRAAHRRATPPPRSSSRTCWRRCPARSSWPTARGTIQLCNEAAATLVGRPIVRPDRVAAGRRLRGGSASEAQESPLVRSERTLLTTSGERCRFCCPRLFALRRRRLGRGRHPHRHRHPRSQAARDRAAAGAEAGVGGPAGRRRRARDQHAHPVRQRQRAVRERRPQRSVAAARRSYRALLPDGRRGRPARDAARGESAAETGRRPRVPAEHVPARSTARSTGSTGSPRSCSR